MHPHALDAPTLDASTLDDHALLERIAADEAHIAALQARQLADLADFARRPARIHRADQAQDLAAVSVDWAPSGDYARESAADEVGIRLSLSRRSAETRLQLACALIHLPATGAALRTGRIDLTRARVIAEETRDLDRATAGEVELQVITAAEHLNAPRLRARLRRAVIAADPHTAQARTQTAEADRRVSVEPAGDGMAWLTAYLTAVEARTIHTALSAAARAAKTATAKTNAALPEDQASRCPAWTGCALMRWSRWPPTP